MTDNKPSNHYESIKVDGLNHTYLLHIPKNFDGKKSLPLLLSLHGGFGNANYQSSKTVISDLADKENFIVEYPEAFKLMVTGMMVADLQKPMMSSLFQCSLITFRSNCLLIKSGFTSVGFQTVAS